MELQARTWYYHLDSGSNSYSCDTGCAWRNMQVMDYAVLLNHFILPLRPGRDTRSTCILSGKRNGCSPPLLILSFLREQLSHTRKLLLHRSSINHPSPTPSPPLGKEWSGTLTHRCVGLNPNSSMSFSYKDLFVWGLKKPCPKSQLAHWRTLPPGAIFPSIRELCKQTRNTNDVEIQGDSEMILAPKLCCSIWIKKFLMNLYSGGNRGSFNTDIGEPNGKIK